jgi:potassium-transporting ATPase potassium-binding subunit
VKLPDYVQIIAFVVALCVLAPPLGYFMARVFNGERTFLSPILGWLERLAYTVSGVDEKEEMNWRDYLKALLVFNFFGFVAILVLQLVQASLPMNPQTLPNVSWHLAFNTAVSFMTNTNWQSYSGENTLSYLTQMLGLTVQNFLSAATGVAVFLALTRGIFRRESKTLGNFWADLTRATVYILLPLCIVFTFVLVSQGVVQTFSGYSDATTLEGAKQTIAVGPAASQIAIKQIGTNGGGFFGANSAHPFENPTPFINFLEMLAILLLPAALVFTYGKMIEAPRQAVTLFIVMLLVWLASLVGSIYSEYAHNPIFNQSAIMEGKETRLGVVNSLMWSTVTTVASNGSVNAMHSSLSPLAGGIAMLNIMLGEVIFGGIGAGMYGMLLYVLLTVFLSGLMVGRSPEYMGKKIEASEIQMAILGIVGPGIVILLGAAISIALPIGLAGLSSKGPHGLSEVLYAYTSAAGNNGSAFAGLNTNTAFYNVLLGLTMLVGRFVVIIPCFAIAGHLVGKKVAPISAGTFATDSVIFGVLLVGVIVIVGALTHTPALFLGPIVEHFLMLQGHAF